MKRLFYKHGLLQTMLILGIFTVFAVTGCSPNVVSAEDLVEEEPTAVSLVWNSSRNCTVCHVAQAESMTNGDLMTDHADLICMDCHTDEEAIEQAHVNLTYASKPNQDGLRMSAVSENLCIDCHGDWVSLSEKTADVTVLTDYNGTTVNPHTITTLVNENGEHDNTTCSSCHSMHTSTTVEEGAVYYCQSCHHENVYECGTCHGSEGG